jgi:serine protease AprX
VVRDVKRRTALGVVGLLAALLVAAVCAGASWGAGYPNGASWDSRHPAGASWDGVPAGRPSVIVRATPGAERRVERAVRRFGGTIERRLGIIHGFAATLPASRLSVLRRVPGVVSVTRNARLEAMGSAYDAVGDIGSMYNVTQMTGARAYWKAGYTGKGVDVALIDSGVVPVDGLTVGGKIVNGADLSFESQAPSLRYLDSFGHGTHMAGIIAGRASAATTGAYATDMLNFLGMAPDVRLISIKVADAHGATDVSQVIAAIDWVVQHKNDPGFNIRVLSLSYGTDSGQDYLVDPLAYAAEVAWKKGIVVVAAAGNDGFSHQGSMTSPAFDPFVLAVGAADSMGTSSLTDDTVPSYSSSGDTGAGRNSRDPDLVAQGSHIVSLRASGSYIDQTYGSTGGVTSGLFRGSGTSQATAVVSGAAALIIQQRPAITPDQLKMLLMSNATRINASNAEQGKGELDLAKALNASTPNWSNGATPSNGTGSLDLARGSVKLVKDGVTLSGEQDIFGMPFVSATMATLEGLGSSWSGGLWNGSSWSGNTWSGSSWSGSSWSSVLWSGSSWSGSSWSGSSWSSNNWLSSTWADNVWADASWK